MRVLIAEASLLSVMPSAGTDCHHIVLEDWVRIGLNNCIKDMEED